MGPKIGIMHQRGREEIEEEGIVKKKNETQGKKRGRNIVVLCSNKAGAGCEFISGL